MDKALLPLKIKRFFLTNFGIALDIAALITFISLCAPEGASWESVAGRIVLLGVLGIINIGVYTKYASIFDLNTSDYVTWYKGKTSGYVWLILAAGVAVARLL